MSNTITWLPGSVPPNADSRSMKRLKDGIAPGDRTDIVCDFSGPLAAVDCDTIATTCSPAVTIFRNDGGYPDLYSLGTPPINSDWTRVLVRLGGGTAGYEYLVSVTIESSASQTLTRSFIIPCTIR